MGLLLRGSNELSVCVMRKDLWLVTGGCFRDKNAFYVNRFFSSLSRSLGAFQELAYILDAFIQ